MLDPSAALPDVPRFIRRHEYERMVAAGLFEDERVELLDGVILAMRPHGPEHDSAIERLNEILTRAVVPRATVRVQSAFAAGDGSMPEPDLAIVPRRDWSREHPGEALLVIEVAQSSLAKDRGAKARVYAESGVPEYWVVNVVDGIVEVHTDPVRGAYTRVTPHAVGERVVLGAFADVVVEVKDVFGRGV
jgi:Uma2 family endonuclease